MNAKSKACDEIGFKSSVIKYSSTVSEKELLLKIKDINNDNDIDGFIVQLPLPNHINDNVISQLKKLDPKTDALNANSEEDNALSDEAINEIGDNPTGGYPMFGVSCWDNL